VFSGVTVISWKSKNTHVPPLFIWSAFTVINSVKSFPFKDSLIDKIEKHKNFLKWLKEIGIKGKTLSVIKKHHPKLFEEFKEIYIENKIRENARKIHMESLSEVPEENDK